VIDFWEKYILVDEIKELVMEAGNYGMLLCRLVWHALC
jgi:hypothetical protein